jgi:hydrogenase maturation protease
LEHALYLAGRERVLFVDASVSAAAPFETVVLSAAREAGFTTHAMSPQALMQVFAQVHGREAPPCTLLAIRGERFELGEPPTPTAAAGLAQALAWALQWLSVENAA